jgi:hypothetical protein
MEEEERRRKRGGGREEEEERRRKRGGGREEDKFMHTKSFVKSWRSTGLTMLASSDLSCHLGITSD